MIVRRLGLTFLAAALVALLVAASAAGGRPGAGARPGRRRRNGAADAGPTLEAARRGRLRGTRPHGAGRRDQDRLPAVRPRARPDHGPGRHRADEPLDALP